MRTIISVFVLAALAVALGAQAQEKKTDVAALTGNPAAVITAQATEVKKGKTASAPAAKKQAEAEPEEGTVMIDSRAGAEDTERYGAQSEGSDAAERGLDVPGGMPSSYGQCKGVMNEGGRTILIFESLEDGTIYFVQVSVGKGSVSWKLVDRILRSAD